MWFSCDSRDGRSYVGKMKEFFTSYFFSCLFKHETKCAFPLYLIL